MTQSSVTFWLKLLESSWSEAVGIAILLLLPLQSTLHCHDDVFIVSNTRNVQRQCDPIEYRSACALDGIAGEAHGAFTFNS